MARLGHFLILQMPKTENTADSTKNSKGAGRGNAPQALARIGNYLVQDSPQSRRETIRDMFFAALDHDTMNDTDQRSAMVQMFKLWTELDEALEVIYGTGEGLANG